MSNNPLVDLLGRLLKAGDERSIEIDILDRGSRDDIDTVRGEDIRASSRLGLALYDGRWIPLHRLQEIRVGGQVEWSRDG